MTDELPYSVNAEIGCWEWTQYLDRNGYARLYDPTRPKGKKTCWAHRSYYERHKGPIPDGYEIDHVCQNTKCVNPEHLDAVTTAEHAARTWRRLGKDDKQKAAAVLRSKGLKYSEIADALRYSGRESAHRAVLAAVEKGLVTADDVPRVLQLSDQEREDIRDMYSMGIPQTELAAWYRVDSSFISRICSKLETRQARRNRGQVA